MHMLSRTSARRLLDKYTQSYAKATLTDSSLTPFSPDWTLTKDGSRALVYPMLALEEGAVATSDAGQIDYHRRCFETNYEPDAF